MIEVFHRKDYSPNIIFEKDLEIKLADYEKVAEIDTEYVGDAWHLTQNSDRSWIKRNEVKLIGSEPDYRSSSIGDVFSINGRLQVVLPEGYSYINWGAKVCFYPQFSNKQNDQSKASAGTL